LKDNTYNINEDNINYNTENVPTYHKGIWTHNWNEWCTNEDSGLLSFSDRSIIFFWPQNFNYVTSPLLSTTYPNDFKNNVTGVTSLYTKRNQRVVFCFFNLLQIVVLVLCDEYFSVYFRWIYTNNTLHRWQINPI
jgi:hypothetical protein